METVNVKVRPGATCVAPRIVRFGPAEVSLLCGRPATAVRLVEGLECPLCASCARELDAEEAEASLLN